MRAQPLMLFYIITSQLSSLGDERAWIYTTANVCFYAAVSSRVYVDREV